MIPMPAYYRQHKGVIFEKINLLEKLLAMFVTEENRDKVRDLLINDCDTSELTSLLDGPQISKVGSDRICHCGECDGYGHVIVGNAARACPNLSRKSNLEGVDRELSTWEGYPPPSLDEIKDSQGFFNSKTFNAVLELQQMILAGEDPRAAILLGGYGASKTQPALALLRECARRGIRIAAVSFPVLVSAYKKGITGNDEVYRTYSKIDRARVVLIDELGREAEIGSSEHARIAIWEIIRRIYQKKFAIITSNLDQNALADYLTGDLVSRLHPKSGYAIHVEDFDSPDLRKAS